MNECIEIIFVEFKSREKIVSKVKRSDFNNANYRIKYKIKPRSITKNNILSQMNEYY